jgi:hypothetical protein
MDKCEAVAVAHDMSVISGGRQSFDGGCYEKGIRFEPSAATWGQKHFAAICRLRRLMGDDTDELDCGHLFDMGGRMTRYSPLDLHPDCAEREAESLAGTEYEGEAREIVEEAGRRRPEFLRAAREEGLLRRNNYDFRFRVIDRWDCEEIAGQACVRD